MLLHCKVWYVPAPKTRVHINVVIAFVVISFIINKMLSKVVFNYWRDQILCSLRKTWYHLWFLYFMVLLNNWITEKLKYFIEFNLSLLAHVHICTWQFGYLGTIYFIYEIRFLQVAWRAAFKEHTQFLNL